MLRLKGSVLKHDFCAKNVESQDKYKVVRKNTKKAVSKARGRVFDGLHQSLGMEEGKGSIYRLTKDGKRKKKKKRDLDQMKCIKDVEGKVLVMKQDIKERWMSYFYKLFNK